MKNFSIVQGSMAGEPHVREGGNNQDAFLVDRTDDYIIGVVCDGVSAGKYSQVGAAIIAKLIMVSLKAHLILIDVPFEQINSGRLKEFIGLVRVPILQKISTIIRTMSDPFDDTLFVSEDLNFVANYMCATSLWFVVTKEYYFTVRTGDGVIMINDIIEEFDSGASNAPDSLTYGALWNPIEGAGSNMSLHKWGPTNELINLMVGSDGVSLFNKKASVEMIDGNRQGSIMQFFQDDRFVRNPLLVQRQLNKIGYMYNNRAGDDVTLVGVRRCKY